MSAAISEILAVLKTPRLHGDPCAVVCGVSHDSRAIRPGWLFIAIPGEKTDGHEYISRAVESGAAAILAQKECPSDWPNSVPWIQVPDTRTTLGPVAAAVYGEPTRSMVLVGITGTNGKTSLTFLLEAIIKAAGGSPGVIGTISHRWADVDRPARHTTPEASDLQSILAEMRDSRVTHVFMEVSSHGLHLGRLAGCHFDLGVFTNLTQDHLDYHGNLEDYFLAKSILFKELLPASCKERPLAAINVDDPYGRRLAAHLEGIPVTGYGTGQDARVRPVNVSMTADGIRGTLKTGRGLMAIGSPLTGQFNLQNVLAAVAVAECLDIPLDAVQQGIESVSVVPGRLERIESASGHVFVDYAHTPNALKNVLDALRAIRSGRIITIMGCGGDRDRTKRPVMGMEAAAGSDFVVVTSDNPRSEDPVDIIRQVEEGVREYGFNPMEGPSNGRPLKSGHYSIIADRREAIAWAIKHLQDHDILLVAGKGHETYQEINGVRYPFDDREVLREELHKISVLDPAPVRTVEPDGRGVEKTGMWSDRA